MIYPILIAAIILSYFIVYRSFHDQKKAKRLFVITAFLLIFLVCVLRKYSVGLDMPKYYSIYLEAFYVPFRDFGYIYFEKGYLLLMKICVALNMPFEWFMVICSLIMIVPVAVFIYNFSDRVLLSTIIFICYMFFEFYLSGLRQAMSMSIWLIGVTILLKEIKFKYIWYALFCIIAYYFHKGAVIGIILPFIFKFKKTILVLIVSLLVLSLLMMFRNQILSLLKVFFERESINTHAKIYVGANAISLIAILAASILFYQVSLVKNNNQNSASLIIGKEHEFLNMMIIGVGLMLFLGLDTTARSSMFYLLAITIVIPNMLVHFDKRSSLFVELIAVVFFVSYFLLNIFINNRFAMLPYRFFWQ